MTLVLESCLVQVVPPSTVARIAPSAPEIHPRLSLAKSRWINSSLAGRALTLPRLARVVGVKQNAVDHLLIPADGTDHPTLFLTRETNAVEFNIGAIKLARQETPHFDPAHAVVARREDCISGDEKTGLFVAKVDIVDRRVRLHEPV